jgi:hypothetical protein
MIPEITCASPAYLDRHGRPAHPRELDGHLMVGFVSSRTGDVMPLEFSSGGKAQEVRLPARVTANDASTVAALACLGYDLVQAPRYRFAEDLRMGRLLEVLADFPPGPCRSRRSTRRTATLRSGCVCFSTGCVRSLRKRRSDLQMRPRSQGRRRDADRFLPLRTPDLELRGRSGLGHRVQLHHLSPLRRTLDLRPGRGGGHGLGPEHDLHARAGHRVPFLP